MLGDHEHHCSNRVEGSAVRLRRKAQRRRPHDPTPVGARVFVEADVTPESLTALYQEYLTSEATAIVGPNIGRWMRVSGPRGDVVPRGRKDALLRFERRGSRTSKRIEMNFTGPDWRARLSEIPRGKEIAVVGVLRAATQSQVTLDHCEVDETFHASS